MKTCNLQFLKYSKVSCYVKSFVIVRVTKIWNSWQINEDRECILKQNSSRASSSWYLRLQDWCYTHLDKYFIQKSFCLGFHKLCFWEPIIWFVKINGFFKAVVFVTNSAISRNAQLTKIYFEGSYSIPKYFDLCKISWTRLFCQQVIF